jgi:hypothetical protein
LKLPVWQRLAWLVVALSSLCLIAGTIWQSQQLAVQAKTMDASARRFQSLHEKVDALSLAQQQADQAVQHLVTNSSERVVDGLAQHLVDGEQRALAQITHYSAVDLENRITARRRRSSSPESAQAFSDSEPTRHYAMQTVEAGFLTRTTPLRWLTRSNSRAIPGADSQLATDAVRTHAFADFPISALADRRTRGEFLAWRDKLAAKSRRQADYAWSVFARILSWGHNRRLALANPCATLSRLACRQDLDGGR